MSIHPAYKNDEELCKWLRENSSGSYRLSAYAAERIETLSTHLQNVQAECNALEQIIRDFKSAYVELTNSVSFADNGEAAYVADQQLMSKFDAVFDKA